MQVLKLLPCVYELEYGYNNILPNGRPLPYLILANKIIKSETKSERKSRWLLKTFKRWNRTSPRWVSGGRIAEVIAWQIWWPSLRHHLPVLVTGWFLLLLRPSLAWSMVRNRNEGAVGGIGFRSVRWFCLLGLALHYCRCLLLLCFRFDASW